MLVQCFSHRFRYAFINIKKLKTAVYSPVGRCSQVMLIITIVRATGHTCSLPENCDRVRRAVAQVATELDIY